MMGTLVKGGGGMGHSSGGMSDGGGHDHGSATSVRPADARGGARGGQDDSLRNRTRD